MEYDPKVRTSVCIMAMLLYALTPRQRLQAPQTHPRLPLSLQENDGRRYWYVMSRSIIRGNEADNMLDASNR